MCARGSVSVCEVVSVREGVAVCGMIDFEFAVKNPRRKKRLLWVCRLIE
jgi:hypothetical protein